MAVLTTKSITRKRMPDKTYTLTERTLLTADRQAVPAGHPDGVVLLGPAGKQIAHAAAVACGLVDVETFPKHIGGGQYELSNGTRVKGKADATAAEAALTGDE